MPSRLACQAVKPGNPAWRWSAQTSRLRPGATSTTTLRSSALALPEPTGVPSGYGYSSRFSLVGSIVSSLPSACHCGSQWRIQRALKAWSHSLSLSFHPESIRCKTASKCPDAEVFFLNQCFFPLLDSVQTSTMSTISSGCIWCMPRAVTSPKVALSRVKWSEAQCATRQYLLITWTFKYLLMFFFKKNI